ncbi:hypothetical protein [Nostoc sp.]|uniref:hypothetical protein n=1 Tax=Nostoc sp. TaxID=1180 RepID=UPI002FF94825
MICFNCDRIVIANIKVERYIKVKGNASPYDGNWTYWSQRKGTSLEFPRPSQ